jgi:hypothetical protein
LDGAYNLHAEASLLPCITVNQSPDCCQIHLTTGFGEL